MVGFDDWEYAVYTFCSKDDKQRSEAKQIASSAFKQGVEQCCEDKGKHYYLKEMFPFVAASQ